MFLQPQFECLCLLNRYSIIAKEQIYTCQQLHKKASLFFFFKQKQLSFVYELLASSFLM